MTEEFKNEEKGEIDEENQREKLEEEDMCDITFIWRPVEDIAREKEISFQHSRKRERTTPENSAEMVAYIKNFITWLSVISRVLLFSAASLMIIMFVIIIYALDLEAKEKGDPVHQLMAREGSISGLTKDQDTVIGRIFLSLINAAAILLLFSNFGFFVLPAWEDSVGPLTGDYGCVARAERTYNWVLSEEGMFKMAYSVIAPTGLIILANVPAPLDNNNSPARHLQFELHLFAIFAGCGPLLIGELYQLIRGEQMFKRCSGWRQVFRFICVVAAAVSFLIYEIMGARHEYGKHGRGKSCKAEIACMIFLSADLIAISFTPIKAEVISTRKTVRGTQPKVNHLSKLQYLCGIIRSPSKNK